MTKARSLSDFIESDGSVTLVDNQKIKVGTGNDLEIYHDGSYSYIREVGTGDLRIGGASNVQIWNSDIDSQMANFANGGAVTLYYAGATKLATTSTGVTVTGNSDVSGELYVGNNNSIFAENVVRFKSSGTAYIDHNTVDADIVFRTSDASALDTTALTLDGSDGGTAIFGGWQKMADNNRIVFGGGSDAAIFSDGTNGYMRGFAALQNNAGDHDYISFVDGGATSLYHDNAVKLATTSDGINVTGRITADNITVDQDGTTTLSTSSSGGNFLNVTHSGNEAWSFGVGSGDGSTDYLDIGINGGTRGLAVYEGGQVAVGAAIGTPDTVFNVYGNNGSAGDLWTQVGPGNIPAITVQNASTTDNNNAALFFKDNDGMRASVAARFVNHSTNETELRFSSTDSSGNTREKMTLSGAGNLGFNSGNGISFSATSNAGNSASMDNELLNDYEAGAWTPQLTDLSGNEASGYQSGHPMGVYTKIGDLCFITFSIRVTNLGSMTGNYVHIKNLPFVRSTTAEGRGSGGIDYYSGWSANKSYVALDASSTAAVFWLVGGTNSTGSHYVTVANLGTTPMLKGWAYYKTP